MLKSTPSIPLPVNRALLKLGADLSLARRRRHISQASLAERMGADNCRIARIILVTTTAAILTFSAAVAWLA